MCFVDQTYTIVPDDTKNMFRNVLSDEAYDAITMHDLENDDYQVGFKYLTFLNKFFHYLLLFSYSVINLVIWSSKYSYLSKNARSALGSYSKV